MRGGLWKMRMIRWKKLIFGTGILVLLAICLTKSLHNFKETEPHFEENDIPDNTEVLPMDLYAYYYHPDETYLFEYEKKPGATENLPLKEALQDERIVKLFSQIVQEKNVSWDELSAAAWEGQSRMGYILDISCGEEKIRIVKNILDQKKVNSNEELWQICTGILQMESTDAWLHETYCLYHSEKETEVPERVVLYCIGDREAGFFYAVSQELYQIILPEGTEGREFLEDAGQYMQRINDAGEENALWQIILRQSVESRLMDNGMSWEDDVVRELVYDAVEETDGVVSQENIQRVSSLTIQKNELKAIKSLKDLNYLTGLKSLSIYGNGDESYPSLQNMWNEVSTEALNNLTELNMVECGLTSISFMEDFPQLVSASFEGNAIRNLSPLSGCKKLEILCLAHNDITDIAPLSHVWFLEELNLQRNNIDDIEALSRLYSLERVDLSFNKISDLSPLSRLTRITSLRMFGNEITDISPLAKLTSLYHLSLDANKIQDIRPLSGMNKMEWLSLSNNQIQDFAPIQGMENLFYLSVMGNSGQDIGNLMLVPWLGIGAWDTDTEEEKENILYLTDNLPSGQEIEVKDYVTGDLNGDGIRDAAILGYLGRYTPKEERYAYVFLGTGQGAYSYHTKISAMGLGLGTKYDIYPNIAIAGDRLVITTYGGSASRWSETSIYEWDEGDLALIYQLKLSYQEDDAGGYDWYVKDIREDMNKFYVITGEWNRKMEWLLLRDSTYDEKMEEYQAAINQEVEALKEKLGGDVMIPVIDTVDYEPDIGRRHYGYQVHHAFPSVAVKTDRVLQEAARRYLPGAAELDIPLYVSNEIKGNYDTLAGVYLPDIFFLGEKDGVPSLLVYERCDVDEDGKIVHVLTLKEGQSEESGSGWWMAVNTIYYHEDTDSFE